MQLAMRWAAGGGFRLGSRRLGHSIAWTEIPVAVVRFSRLGTNYSAKIVQARQKE
jgi:hypothetical protein